MPSGFSSSSFHLKTAGISVSGIAARFPDFRIFPIGNNEILFPKVGANGINRIANKDKKLEASWMHILQKRI